MFLRSQFLCHVLIAIIWIKIGLKLGYFWKNIFERWGLHPQTSVTAFLHYRFLATRLLLSGQQTVQYLSSPFSFLVLGIKVTEIKYVSRQLTVTNWLWTNWCQLAEKGDHNIILLSPEPSCPNPHFVTKLLRRNRWFTVSLSRLVDWLE